MNVGDNVNKESAELINQRQDGNNKGFKEPDSLDEDELKNNRIAENVKDRREGAFRSPSILQVSQQQPQGTTVCWERFLHLRSLKVLLVEKDDCTRHVVAALLRNCSYDAIEAANGLQAWKILDDASYRIDLVLTEVAMPFLSGIGLLSKIMNHKTRHNVPVIMMSSHDSMGLVFKCLSKGAVDFLVKPIRKNELKNLWQHVWRRCHSSSGSGSESGTQTQKSVKSKSAEKSDNNTGSNDGDENESIDLNVGDGSDDGSGTQSSWTKQVVEAESPKPIALRDQIVECPDSTCAQVIHSNAEASVIRQVPVTSTRECQGQEQQLDHVLMGKELEISTPEGMNLQVEFPNQVTKTNVMEMGHGQFNEHIDNVEDGLNIESPSPNLTCVVTNTTNPQMDNPGLEAPNRLNISCTNHTTIAVDKELPSLEFSLKRVRGVKGAETVVREERNVLRRSDSSAFSRYNTASNSNKAPSEKLGKSVPLDNSIGVLVTESVQNVQFHSNGDPSNQFSNGGSNNIDMGSTTNKVFKKPLVSKLKSMASSSVKCLSPSSAFQPLKSDLPCSSQLAKLNKSGDIVAATAQSIDLHQEVQVQHIHHHYSHFLVHSMQQQQQQQLPFDHDELSLKKMATSVPHCGSSNVLSGILEGNVGNSSFYGSVSGSNFGSNGHNGSSAAVNAGGKNVESDNGIPGKSGSGDASGSGNENRVYQNKLKQREAALTKFRLKRKERCFRKKVRYQSRKKLAEQRPRVRGQFVRQKSNDNTSQTSDT